MRLIGDKLKASLLQDAFQGKLTKQLPEDGDARDLLKEIKAEKERLVKEKKIKEEKPLPVIKDKEIPFDIPKNWVWTRLGDCSLYIQRGKSPRYSVIKKYPVISQKCIQWSGFDISAAKFIDPDSVSLYGDERILQDNDLLWNSTGTGTVGRVTHYIKNNNSYNFGVADSHVTVIRFYRELMDPIYIEYFIRSEHIQKNIENLCTGSTKQKELSLAVIKSLPIPLPPLAEQRRIVDKLKTALEKIDILNDS
ncbi:restriction endonuclease subunit S [Bartonella sp. M0283]|uniref:restriction endonuclease subunit S n=1 Tax=Bartonella sp. M0283 TaxID=2751016 RepID=UPI0018DC9C3C|nr:restriction endonuclease subunit S [Bartonella sp. M0283]MBI0162119.1 restriction endonuclease subunit S [Bartonella sp. M0283]